MKKHQSELFDLIKTMTPSESRYFLLYAKRHFSKDTHYLTLYLSLQKMSSYDEVALLRSLQNYDWIKHIAVIKNQLYYTILEALHQFDEYGSLVQEIKKGIHFCALLLKKGLFVQCKKLLVKYKAKAYALEKYESVLELIELEKKLINRAFIHEEDDAAIHDIDEEEKRCLAQINLSAKYWKQSSLIYKQHYQKKIGMGQSNEVLHQLVQQEDFSNYERAKTTKAKLDFLQINALYSFTNKDTKQAFEYNKQFLLYLDAHQKMRMLFADRYFSVLNNYLIDSLILRKYDILKNGIVQIREIAKLPEFKHINNIDANVFRLSYTLELNYTVSQLRFEEGLTLLPSIEDGLAKYRSKIVKPSRVTMQYLMAYILFFNQQYARCLDCLDAILNDKDAMVIKDIYRDAKFMQLLCHFEFKHFALVDSLMISFQRFVLKEKMVFKTYSTIMKYFSASIKNPHKDYKSKLQQDLKLLENEPSESNVFNNFNYLLWLARA
jgi:hypothetical protein